LSQAAFLALTSARDRTVPTRRGKWILTRLLCSPPGEPPANVPPLEQVAMDAQIPVGAPIRAKLEVVDRTHTATCAAYACHSLMDPLGLGLEHYDGVGAWRDSYAGGVAIDATGQMPGPMAPIPFDGAEELARALKEDPRVLGCLTQNFFSYALGREP